MNRPRRPWAARATVEAVTHEPQPSGLPEAWDAVPPCGGCMYASDGKPSARSACQRCSAPQWAMFGPREGVGDD